MKLAASEGRWKHRARIIVTGLLVLLAAGSVWGIVSFHSWGGRMEMLLLVFGDRVWVTIDAGRPRILLLLLVPTVLLAAAVSPYVHRSGE